MNRIQLLSAVLGLTLWACSLTAAPVHADETKAPADHITYTFDDDLVRGDLLGPETEVLHARRNQRRDSLVRARHSFVVELLHSVEGL